MDKTLFTCNALSSSLKYFLLSQSLILSHIFERRDPYTQKKGKKSWPSWPSWGSERMDFFLFSTFKQIPSKRSLVKWEMCGCTIKILKGSFCRFVMWGINSLVAYLFHSPQIHFKLLYYTTYQRWSCIFHAKKKISMYKH